MIKKTIKISLLVTPILALILLASTFIPLGQKDTSGEVDIYLVSNDIHVGIMLPRYSDVFDWNIFLVHGNFVAMAHERPWIEFGWGDRMFYFEMPTWDHFTWRLAADALFLPDPAVMHVGLSPKLDESKYVRKISISKETYRKLVEEIKTWFLYKDGKPILIPGKGYSPHDQFFEARGSYSILNTCNVWTSDVLASAGLLHPFWSPTKYGLEFMWDKKN